MSVVSRAALGRVFADPVAGNALALYLTQFGTLLIPLATLPYLARVLRPEGWGLVVFAQSFAAWLSLLIEYGFRLSMTRELARRRDDPDATAQIVSHAFAAQVVLAAVSTVAAAVAWFLVPRFQEATGHLVLALVLAIALGFSPAWYFQGVERVRAYAAATLAGQLIYLVGVFAVVRDPSDGWKVLALQAAAVGAVTVFCLTRVARAVRVAPFAAAGAARALRGGFGLFLFLNLVTLYTAANAFLLGLVAPAATAMRTVSYFAGAERLLRGVLGLFAPIAQALYPRLSHLASSDPAAAARLSRLTLVAMLVLGVAIAGGLFAGAPLLVRLLLGPGYEAAANVLRILALLAPLVAVSTTLGTLWMLPIGMDRPMAVIVLGAGVLNVVLALAWATRTGEVGMAWAVVVAEAVVAAGMALVLVRRGRDPFRAGAAPATGATGAAS